MMEASSKLVEVPTVKLDAPAMFAEARLVFARARAVLMEPPAVKMEAQSEKMLPPGGIAPAQSSESLKPSLKSELPAEIMESRPG